jgi:hypothetical protein
LALKKLPYIFSIRKLAAKLKVLLVAPRKTNYIR